MRLVPAACYLGRVDQPKRRGRSARSERPTHDRRRPTGSRHRGVPLSPPGPYPTRPSPTRCLDGLLSLRALWGCPPLRGRQRGQGTGDRVATMAGSQEAAGLCPLEQGKYCGNVTHQSAWMTFLANFRFTAFARSSAIIIRNLVHLSDTPTRIQE